MKQAMKRVKKVMSGKKGHSMRKTTVLITAGALLWVGAAFAVEGNGKLSSTVGTAEARVFNVLKYGAVGDDKTDNTAAFSACLKAVIAVGGGRMVLPAGVYRGGIVIPAVSKPMPSWITVEITGELEPTPVFGTIGSFPLLNNGVIVKSLSKAGPAVISASSSPASLCNIRFIEAGISIYWAQLI